MQKGMPRFMIGCHLPLVYVKDAGFLRYTHHNLVPGFFKILIFNYLGLLLAANRAASLTIFARSAPELPGVALAITDSFTLGDR